MKTSSKYVLGGLLVGTVAVGGTAAAQPKVAPAPPTPAPVQSTTANLGDLQDKLEQLKEDLLRQHIHLSDLGEAFFGPAHGASRVVLKFDNAMSTAFLLTRAVVVLDGAPLLNKSDSTGSSLAGPEIPIFDGQLEPGDHTVQALVGLQGNGYGVFKYLRDFHFEVRSSHSFTVKAGSTITIDVGACEKESLVGRIEDRPSVCYDEHTKAGLTGTTDATK